jgi:DNA-binding CsgD family transcriptional regulator
MDAALTPRQREVLLLVAEGLTNADIARRLWISPGTVRRHLENVFARLDVHTRAAAVAHLLRASTPHTAEVVAGLTAGALRPHVDVDGARDLA